MVERPAWRRRALVCAIGVLAVPVVALAVVLALSELRLQRCYKVPARAVSVPSDPGSIARGRHLAHSVAQCAHCHGDDLAGRLAADEAALGRLVAPNLTAGEGGVGAVYSDVDLARAIRHGVNPEGRALLIMPAQYLRALSDRDLGALIAYLRTVPRVDRVWPSRKVGLLTRLALVAGRAPDLLPAEQIDHAAPAAHGPATGDAEGRYLVDLGGCRVCHGADLSGGLHALAVPGEPVPPDLTPSGALGSWSETDFVRTLRSGVTPAGSALDPRFMPWRRFAGMSDDELRAIWRYLTTVPPRA